MSQLCHVETLSVTCVTCSKVCPSFACHAQCPVLCFTMFATSLLTALTLRLFLSLSSSVFQVSRP